MKATFPCELQKRFEQALVAGEYTRGDVLTATALANRFQATEDEAQQVLLAEHRKGLVGKCGTEFPVLGELPRGLESLFSHTSRSGLDPSSEVRAAEIGPASPAVAEKLQIEVGAPVYRYERTRYVGGEPLANQINWVPYEVCPGLEHDDVSHSSFQRLLEGKYMAVAARFEEQVLIATATAKDREILDLPEGASVVVVERLLWSITERPLVWAEIRIRKDRYKYVARLWPAAAALLDKENP